MLGFKSFRRAQTLLAGIELIHMIRKGQYQPPLAEFIASGTILFIGCLKNRQRNIY
ncbi:hypothetical protein DFO62_1453 [Serratia fonticola]|nr:hypothetical protein DFO62_1453 [Serratia fonticola]